MAKLTIQDLKKIKEKVHRETALRDGAMTTKITVHMGTCGIAAGAREIMSSETVLMLIDHLGANYGVDPAITWLLDNRELYIVPIVNPDGVVWNETIQPEGGGMWRKNRRPKRRCRVTRKTRCPRRTRHEPGRLEALSPIVGSVRPVSSPQPGSVGSLQALPFR